ncbi:hypothetical protein J6590_081804 [Homalodisca vitripennis]|nr:hypothetical protein J6590_081804 [Homalodisca vitripennis]
MKRYELVLDEPDRVFFSGDEIKGHVAVTLDSNITVQAWEELGMRRTVARWQSNFVTDTLGASHEYDDCGVTEGTVCSVVRRIEINC